MLKLDRCHLFLCFECKKIDCLLFALRIGRSEATSINLQFAIFNLQLSAGSGNAKEFMNVS